MNDAIHIRGLKLDARVGVPDEERASAQSLVANITFWLPGASSDRPDDISATIDYSAVAGETDRFVRRRSDKLIETLADALAQHLLQTFAIEKIVIEIRKFVLAHAEYVSVTITRERRQD